MTRSQFIQIGLVIFILFNSNFLLANPPTSIGGRENESFSEIAGKDFDKPKYELLFIKDSKPPKKPESSTGKPAKPSKPVESRAPKSPGTNPNIQSNSNVGSCSPQNLSFCTGVASCHGLNVTNAQSNGNYFWNDLIGSCVFQPKLAPDLPEPEENSDSVAQKSLRECALELGQAEAACYESRTSAESSCKYSESETAQSVQTATSQISAVVQQMNTGNLGTAGSLGSISGMTVGAKAALAGMQGKCSYDRNSCVTQCAAAKAILQRCSSHTALMTSYQGRINEDADKCGDLESSLQAMDKQMEGLLRAANGLTTICEQASYKNNPICTGNVAGLNSASGIVDCFANPSHSSCQVASGTQSKLNSGVTALPTMATSGSRGAGITGGSLGGDGTDYNSSMFKLGNDNGNRDIKVPSAKMGPGAGGGGMGGGGGGLGGAGGGGSAGSAAANNSSGGGTAGSDLDLNFAKLNGDDTIARRMGMGGAGIAGQRGLPYQRDKNGNLIYPDARSLKLNMNRFRPSLGGGRGIAGSTTLGPDGITDGNSDLWKKINIQYNSQEDTLD